MEFYWALKYGYKDDIHTVYISPDKVELVKKRWDNGQPIHTTTGSIPANQIREFEQSDRPFGDQKLLEDASQAFKEPIIVKGETVRFDTAGKGDKPNIKEITYTAIQGKWVKQIVTLNKWEKYYSLIAGYRFLSQDNNMVTMAFVLATHDINQLRTPYCTDIEVRALEGMRASRGE